MIPVWLGLLLSLLWFVSLGTLSLSAMALYLRAHSARTQLTAALIFFFWFQCILFYPFAFTHTFSVGWLVPALVLTILANVVLCRQRPELPTSSLEQWRAWSAPIREDLASAWRSPLFRGVVLVGGGLCLFALLRELVMPMVAWDSMTYQLGRPELWVQDAGWTDYDAPGQWQKYKYYYPTGNTLTAWALVFARHDALAPIVWAGVALTCWWGVFAACRELDIDPKSSGKLALLGVLVPAISTHMYSANVDNLVAALAILSMVLTLGLEKSRDARLACVICLALASNIMTKQTSMAFVGMNGLVVLYLVARHRQHIDWRQLVPALLGMALIIAPHIAYVWHETGNPLWPYPLHIGDTISFEGHAFAEGKMDHGRSMPLDYKLLAMFAAGYDGFAYHINLGATFWWVILVSPLALIELVRDPERRWRSRGRATLLGLSIAACFTLAIVLYTPTGSGMNEARYATASVLYLAVLLGIAPQNLITRAAILGTLAANVFYLLPFHWSPPDTEGGLLLGAILAGGAIVGALVWRALSSATEWSQIVGACLGGVLALCVSIAPIKARYATVIYEAVAQRETYTNTPIDMDSFMSSEVFAALAKQEEPARYAFTVGWDERGINWFITPVIGDRFQHELYYIPPTRDGELPGYVLWQPYELDGDYERWLERLRDARIDYVITLEPATDELGWMEEHPEVFELVAQGPGFDNRLYRLRDPKKRE